MPSSSYIEDQHGDPEDDYGDDHNDNRIAYPTLGPHPVNAITGRPYPHRLGSTEQLRLFEVRSTSGWLDSVGGPAKPGQEALKDPLLLFYDSPKQYLYHRAMALGMGTSEGDIEHLMRYGFAGQPAFDLAAWAEMTTLWKSRQPKPSTSS